MHNPSFVCMYVCPSSYLSIESSPFYWPALQLVLHGASHLKRPSRHCRSLLIGSVNLRLTIHIKVLEETDQNDLDGAWVETECRCCEEQRSEITQEQANGQCVLFPPSSSHVTSNPSSSCTDIQLAVFKLFLRFFDCLCFTM